jgi:hypothetical protein
MEVHHSYDGNRLASELVNHSEGKSVGPTPTSSWGKRSPSFMVVNYSSNGPPYFGSKFVSETFALAIIVVDSLQQLGLRRVEECHIHQDFPRSMSLKIFLAGVDWISPRS